MARNLVLCFDGTNNEFGPENTNVVRLVQVLDRDPMKQRLYYDPGVGTLPEPGALTRFGKWVSKVAGLAFGTGIFPNVEEAYEYLMDYWEPGDHVFLFGFSRGAYTARLLAAMLHQLGLLPRGNRNLVPYVSRLFQALPSDDAGMHAHFALSDQFRWTFSRVVPGSPDRRFPVHFVGLWDTVSSVGWVWDPGAYPFTKRNPSIGVVRHAVSIDERRSFFRQNRMEQADARQNLQELWFPGVHSDVGGGYRESEGGLWRRPLSWILEEADKAGLMLDAGRLHDVMHKTPASQDPYTDPQHESLKGWWWLAEVFPKLRWFGRLRIHLPAINAGRHRFIHAGALIDRCALIRLRDKSDYRPPNLSTSFVSRVQSLSVVPPFLPYS